MVIGIIAIYYINKCDELERDYEILSVKYEASQINYDVNKDGKVNSQDYVAIKNYIMQDKCYVDGGWNCE